MKYSVTLMVLSIKIYIKQSHEKDHTRFRSQFPRVSSSADINSMSTGEQILKKSDFCFRCSNNKYNIFFGGGGWGSDDTESYLEASPRKSLFGEDGL